MALRVPGGVVLRVMMAAMFICTGAMPALGQSRQAPKGDQKPDSAAGQAQAQAQQQEIQTLVRVADSAMSGQPAPADFPIQFQNDFLKAQGNRVWVPITLTLDPAKLSSPALTLYLRVVPRGTTAPPAPKDSNKEKDKKDPKAAAPGPAYPYEDVSFMDVKPAGPGQPIRIYRGIGVPAGSYDLYIVLHERPAAGAAAAPGTPAAATPAPAGGKTSVLKQPLDVPNYTT